MGIATREVMIEAHKLALKQLEGMTPGTYVSGQIEFKAYKEALEVEEVVVEYMARDQRTASKVSVRVWKITEAPRNRGGRTLNLPYSINVYRGGEGYGPDLAPEAILIVQEHHGDHKAWVRLEGQEDWKPCNGFAIHWYH